MATCIFLLGRPGSGKSAAARHIKALALRKDWGVERVNDYEVLNAMAHDEATKHLFRLTSEGGVDVLDTVVLDIALRSIIDKAEFYMSHAPANTLILIEFARSDYDIALARFSQEMLQQAHILFIDADIELCKQRIHRRCEAPVTEDDHPLSDYALTNYYANQYLSNDKLSHVQKIVNQGTPETFYNLVDQFAAGLL